MTEHEKSKNDPMLAFSIGEDATDANPERHECTFTQLVEVLEKDDRGEGKGGRYLAPAIFKGDHRAKATVESVSMLGYDIENHPIKLGDIQARLPYLL